MPTFTGKTFASFYKNLLGIDQTSNTGVDATTRQMQDGAGNNTAISLSDDVLSVQPINDDTTGAMLVKTQGGSNILAVDTDNKLVKVGSSQVSATTLFKEMGIYDFSPNAAGYHYPLIANTMVVSSGAAAFAYDNDWGNGADPATALDVSGLTTTQNAIAVYWYLENAITIDSVRYMATSDGSATLNFHLFEYTLDTSTNHGDLSSGSVVANASVAATATTIKTGTFTVDSANVAAGKVIIGFVENVTDTSDVSVAFNIKYNIQ